MPKRSKRFIDKKKAVTFQLVHRSQKDPLVTDENAPKRVLRPIVEKERDDELEKYGIYFDDDYDYMQHLKPASGKTMTTLLPVDQPVKQKKETTKISLPSSVFQSNVEEKVGVLNKAAPSRGLDLSLDPDIVAAMDSDYDYSDPENEFEDDFVLQLNAEPEHDSDVESDAGSMDGYEDEEEEDIDSDEVGSLGDFETKSRFTDYSMTSSVIRRNEQLRHLDDRFEQMYAGYDDTEIGALDCEDIEGEMDPKNQLLVDIAQQFQQSMAPEKLVTHPTEFVDSESNSDESDCSLVEIKETEKWDCESILSTYSNIYNHPKLIDAPPSKIKINAKTGIPETKVRLTAKALSALNANSTEDNRKMNQGPRSLASAVSLLSIRPKDEKPEEKLERKKAFREHKQERRKEKKLNTIAFKEEKRRMEKMMAHNKSNHIVKI